MVDQRQRIDKWLWHARFAKTRTSAQKLVTSGKIRIDREKVTSPSKLVEEGNVLTITQPRAVRVIKVLGFAERRGSFEVAKTLYEDLDPPSPKIKNDEVSGPVMTEFEPGKRPDKRQRRERLKLKHNSTE